MLMRIPFVDLAAEYRHMKPDIDRAIAKCLEHQRWILGPEVGELEQALCTWLGRGHCVAVASGTDALVLALRAIAIRTTGKEYFDETNLVLTTPFTFAATAEAVLSAGATPLFCDIDPDTFNLDASQVEQARAEFGKRVIGLLPVHLFGQPSDLDALLPLARDHGLFLVEDAAQAFGARWHDQSVGTFGTAAGFSFFPTKNFGAFGDGGLVTTGDESLTQVVRSLRQHGGLDRNSIEHVGMNSRLDTLQAAVLLAKLRYVADFTERRRRNAALYDRLLSGVPGIVTPRRADAAHHVYHQYTVRVQDGRRDALREHLKTQGIGTLVYYPVPLHHVKVFQGRSVQFGGLEQADRAAAEVLSLPIGPLTPLSAIEEVAATIRTFMARP